MRELVWRAGERLLRQVPLRNVHRTAHGRRALLLYRTGPFRFPARPERHQNEGQMRRLARAIAERGYDLDVADAGLPAQALGGVHYDLVVDLHPQEPPAWGERLAPGARRIAYITGSDPRTSNAAERARLADLERRRGVRLRPRRQVPPFTPGALEPLDGMLSFAGAWALSTYRDYRLPALHRLVNSGYDDVEPTDPARRDPRRFLFLASRGMVHKGLDLLLEAVAAEPGLELVVCAQFARERDFVRAYRRELLGSSRVRPAEFLDVRSAAFREIQAGCGAVVLPSCAEAQCGSLTVAMSFGLPVVKSQECDLDEPELLTLPDCSVGTLRATLRALAGRSAREVAEQSEGALSIVRARYRPTHYEISVRAALDALLDPGGAR